MMTIMSSKLELTETHSFALLGDIHVSQDCSKNKAKECLRPKQFRIARTKNSFFVTLVSTIIEALIALFCFCHGFYGSKSMVFFFFVLFFWGWMATINQWLDLKIWQWQENHKVCTPDVEKRAARSELQINLWSYWQPSIFHPSGTGAMVLSCEDSREEWGSKFPI